MHTPSILLLNKTTHAEAILELRKVPLNFSDTVAATAASSNRVAVYDLITERTLSRIEHIYLGPVSHWLDMTTISSYFDSYTKTAEMRLDAKWRLKTLTKDVGDGIALTLRLDDPW